MVESCSKTQQHAHAKWARRQKTLFALLMSLLTVNIVTLSILLLNRIPASQLAEKWLHSACVAWPIVFVCILLIAPWLQRRLEHVYPPPETGDED